MKESFLFVWLVLDTSTFTYIYDLEKNAGCFRITAFYLHLYKVGRLVRHIKNKTQWFKSIREKWSAPKTLAFALYTILLLGLVKLCARRNTDFPSKLEPLWYHQYYFLRLLRAPTRATDKCTNVFTGTLLLTICRFKPTLYKNVQSSVFNGCSCQNRVSHVLNDHTPISNSTNKPLLLETLDYTLFHL